jgi:UDPglucose 6-dehydrogenase
VASEPDVAVVGLWHLGSVAAAGWATSGKHIVAWDPDPDLRAEIRAARAPVAEPGVEESLRSALEQGRLAVVAEAAEAVGSAPVTHLAYDTAVSADGRHEDERLDDAAERFAKDAPDEALLLVSSQILVGTCARWRDLLDAQDRGLSVAHVPENLRLGRALDDFLHPDRVIVGADDDRAFARAIAALGSLATEPLRVGLAAAELAKHATNAYLALCIAFANDLAWVAKHVGADPEEVATALRADPRVAPAAPLRPGAAFSGATLLRDVAALRGLGKNSGRPDVFASVIAANERHAGVALAWLEEALGDLRGRRVAVAGLTYKPGTSTLRDSLPLRLVNDLLERGALVTAWDPAAEDFEQTGLQRVPSFEASVAGADALVVMTDLPELAAVDWSALAPAAKVVIDGCMAVDRTAAETAGWTYFGLKRR